MCSAGIIAVAGLAISGVAAYSEHRADSAATHRNYVNTQNKVNSDTYQYYRDLEFQEMQSAFAHQQFTTDMQFKSEQMAHQQESFSAEAAFRMEELNYELLQHEMAIKGEHEEGMSNLEYAKDSMEAAYDAAEFDQELLGKQWEQLSGQALLDKVERKRQAMKEQAQIRVSQGESGIFGNSALKELANSVMQSSYDQGIIGYNLRNTGEQNNAQSKKIMATAESRTNEALSGVVNRYVTTTSMNPANVGLQI